MKAFIFILFTFYISLVDAQDYLIDLRVLKIQYSNDSTVFDQAKHLEILTNKITEIVSLGTVGELEIGIQLEILKSELEGTTNHIQARVYYYKESESGEWKKISSYGHSRTSVNDINSRDEADKKREQRIKSAPNERLRKMFSRPSSDSVGDPEYFRIEYLLDVYLNE